MSDGAKGDFFTINWGWGVSVTLAVLISGGISGGHVNPAVTVAMSVIGKLPLIKVVPYIISQVSGICKFYINLYEVIIDVHL